MGRVEEDGNERVEEKKEGRREVLEVKIRKGRCRGMWEGARGG